MGRTRSTFSLTLLVAICGCSLALAQTAAESAAARAQIRRFASGEQAEIVDALKALLAMGPKAVPALVEALGDDDVKLATYAGSTLSRIGEPAIPALIEALGVDSDQARNQAFSALVRIGEPAIPAAEGAARSGSPRVREGAAAVLTKLGRTPPPGASPSPAATPSPRATPTRRTQVTKVPPLRGEVPAEPSVPGASSGVDDDRQACAEELIARLQAHVDAGEHDAARGLLWGVWAQAKRERLWNRRRYGSLRQAGRDRLAEIEASYGRARDLVYGSTPPLAGDDDADAVAELLSCVDGALARRDLSTARVVLQHANNRKAAGVGLSPEQQQQLARLLERYAQENKATVQRLFTALNAFNQQVKLREGLAPEAQLHALYTHLQRAKQVDGRLLHMDKRGLKSLETAQEWALGLLQDLPVLVEGLPAFAAAAPDPEYTDSVFAAMISKQPQQVDTYVAFTGGVRLAAYGELLFARWELREILGGTWLTYADRCLDEAEKAYLLDKAPLAEGHLKDAATSLGNARTGGASAEAVALREGRASALRASAGLGKLRRGLRVLDEASQDLTYAQQEGSPDRWEDGQRRLAAARDWLTQARAGGLSAGDQAQAQARLDEVTALAADASAAIVRTSLQRAGAQVREAQELLRDGASAWRASSRIDRAEREHAQAREALAQLPDEHAQRTTLGSQVDALGAQVPALREQVVGAQRLPADAYTGGDGERWRRELSALLAGEREWEVLGLAITSPTWKDKEARYEYRTGANEITVETRWYRQLFAWVALPDPDDASRVALRYLGFRLHKYTDGSYRKLKLFYVDPPLPMLRANLPE